MKIVDQEHKRTTPDGVPEILAVIVSDADLTPPAIITGADVDGVDPAAVFAPGSVVVVPSEGKTYLAGESGEFVLWAGAE